MKLRIIDIYWFSIENNWNLICKQFRSTFIDLQPFSLNHKICNKQSTRQNNVSVRFLKFLFWTTLIIVIADGIAVSGSVWNLGIRGQKCSFVKVSSYLLACRPLDWVWHKNRLITMHIWMKAVNDSSKWNIITVQIYQTVVVRISKNTLDICTE